MNLKLSPITIISLSIIVLTSVILILFKDNKQQVTEVNIPPTNEVLTNTNSPVSSETINSPDSTSTSTLNPLVDGTTIASDTSLKTGNFYITKNVVEVYEKPDQNSERVTQALHGEPVKIIEKQGNWLKVTLTDQFDYSGWLKEENIKNIPADQQWLNPYIIAVLQAKVLVNPHNNNEVMEILGIGTVVNAESSSDLAEFTKIQLVDGRKGYIKTTDLLKYNQKTGSQVSGEEILRTAKQLLNKPYLWGGMSTNGVDCSGFVHTVFKVHGIKLHRDADLQYEYDGVSIAQSELQTGDLIFFKTYKSGASHLGIYVGNRQFINSASSLGVSYASLDNPYFSERYLGAKRILN